MNSLRIRSLSRFGSTTAAQRMCILAALLTAAAALLPAAGWGQTWPASEDRQVPAGGDVASPAVAAATDGVVVVAITRFTVTGAEVHVLRSDADGLNFSSIGRFWDPDPLHNYSNPDLVVHHDSDTLVLSMLEQLPSGFRVSVATTPTAGMPQWTSRPAVTGAELAEPIVRITGDDAPILHVLVRAVFVVDGFVEIGSALRYARSTDLGQTWEPFETLEESPFPSEITSYALAAGDGGRVHVSYVRGPAADGALYYRRHPDGGDSSSSWEPALRIAGETDDVDEAALISNPDGPELLGIYRIGTSGLRLFWSPNDGNDFPLIGTVVVGPGETPDGPALGILGGQSQLVYRSVGARLKFRPLAFDSPLTVFFPSIVSDLGEPPLTPVDVSTRPGQGAIAVWLRDDGGGVRVPFVDAFWFPSTVAVADAQALPAPPFAIRLAPNPFRASLTVDLEGADEGARDLRIYDAGGRLVRRLEEGARGAQLTWDGRDARGREVAAGVYYLIAETAAGAQRARVTKLR